jgi:hypothetical protein
LWNLANVAVRLLGSYLDRLSIARPTHIERAHRVRRHPKEAVMRKAFGLALFVVASVVSGGCYVTQDASGQWYACEDYATGNGPASACTPIQKPF